VDHVQEQENQMIKLLGKKLFVQRIKEDMKTAAGILLTGERDGPAKGIVVYAGNESEVDVGDIVYFPKSNASPIKILDEEFLLLTDAGLICITPQEV